MIRTLSATASVISLMLTFPGCAGSEEPQNPAKPAHTETAFDPAVLTDEKATETIEIAASNGTITLTVPYPVVKVTGVEPEISEAFAAAVARHKEKVSRHAAALEGTVVEGCDDACTREAVLEIAHAGVFKHYGSVALTTSWAFGASDRNALVHTITMDLKTGKEEELSAFLDLSDPEVAARALATVHGAANGADCDAEQHLSEIHGFAPNAEGVLLMWQVDQTQTTQCGIESILVPREG